MKVQAVATNRPDCDLFKLSKEHTDETSQCLEEAYKKSENTIEKLEKSM